MLGLRVLGGGAKPYVDPDPFKGSATEAANRLGLRKRAIFYRRAKPVNRAKAAG